MLKVLSFITFVLIFTSCGYKPTSIYTKQILGSKIYTEVKISIKDPENSVLIKDALNEAVVNQFRSTTATKKDADSKLYIKLNSVKFTPIQYDKNGYVIAYKTYVGLKSEYVDINGKRSSLNSTGDYDFPIESNSLISDTKRFEAIKFASQKALDELRSLIAIKALK